MEMAAARVSRSTPLRVALAGAGMINWYHLTAWRNVGPRARVVAVADPDPARARARADEFSIPSVYADADSMLGKEELDALDVASPRETHATWVEAAAARGVDVLCQKRLCRRWPRPRRWWRRVVTSGGWRARFRAEVPAIRAVLSRSLAPTRRRRVILTRGYASDADRSRPCRAGAASAPEARNEQAPMPRFPRAMRRL